MIWLQQDHDLGGLLVDPEQVAALKDDSHPEYAAVAVWLKGAGYAGTVLGTLADVASELGLPVPIEFAQEAVKAWTDWECDVCGAHSGCSHYWREMPFSDWPGVLGKPHKRGSDVV